jgi:hypothetical protein
MWRISTTTAHTATVFALLCGSAHAQSCALPAPLQSKFENFAHLDANASVSGCRLTAMVNASAPRSALAYAYYQRPPSNSPLRFGFRIDTGGLTSLTSALRRARIFAASARDSHPVANGTPQLVEISLVGNGAGLPTLFISVADNSSPSLSHSQSVTLSQIAATVRIELIRGVGGPGSFRYWIDADYTDPATGIIESSPGAGLDNSEWGPAESVALGLGEMSSAFRLNSANMPLVFDQIQSDDEHIFLDGFE